MLGMPRSILIHIEPSEIVCAELLVMVARASLPRRSPRNKHHSAVVSRDQRAIADGPPHSSVPLGNFPCNDVRLWFCAASSSSQGLSSTSGAAMKRQRRAAPATASASRVHEEVAPPWRRRSDGARAAPVSTTSEALKHRLAEQH